MHFFAGMHKRFLGYLVGMLVASAAPLTAAAQDYTLGTMDKVTVRVVEWQTTEGAVRDWSSVSGDYTVGPSGRISVPFVGDIEAAGKTTQELAATIGDALQQTLGLMDRPEAAVELAEFRPIFMAGDVETPGRYPFDPNLTVLKAVSIAGGIRRSTDTGMRLERDFINASGQRDVLAVERSRLIAKRARLLAESSGRDEIEFPAELSSSEEGQRLMESERAFMTSRAQRLAVQLAEIDDLKSLLESEIAALERKIETQQRQTDLARDELTGIGDLATRGLVVNERVLSLERQIADLEGRVLDMETAALRARQSIAEATQDANALRDDYETGISQDLQQTEAELNATELKITTQGNLILEALARAPEAAAGAASSDQLQIGYVIVRDTNGEVAELPADESTPVLPGDVVKVDIQPVASQ
jgi:polysaccharide biosynthesis/export protein ExoF